MYSITTVYNIVNDDTDGDSVNNNCITILLLSYQAPITEKKRPSKLVFLIGLSSMFSGQSTHFNHIHVIISISWMDMRGGGGDFYTHKETYSKSS